MIPAPGGGLFVIGGGYYDERAWIARLRPDGLDTTWGVRGYVVRKPDREDYGSPYPAVARLKR